MQSLSRRLAPLAGAVIFGLALWGVHHALRHYHYAEVLRDLRAIPRPRLALALVLTALGYLALTGYDALALRYVRHGLPYRRIGLASFVSYAFSNTLGLSALTGASMRYRLYSTWQISGPDVARIIAFCLVTLWVGLLTVSGTALLVEPRADTTWLRLPWSLAPVLGIACLAVVLGYLLWAARGGPPVRLRGLNFPAPTLRLAVGQVLVGSAEWILAASVLYVLLPGGSGMPFPAFAGMFVLAQGVGLASNVPGGLGVFDGIMLLLGRGRMSAGTVAGALLAYRAIYYLVPLGAATVALGAHELLRGRERVRRVASAFGRWVPQLAPTLFAAVAFAAGAILLFSGATPAVPARLAALERLLPLPLLEVSHFAGSVAGVGLLLLAQGLQRRLDGAWALTAALLSLGIAASLLKGFDYEEAAALTLVLLTLLPCRRFFYRRASLLQEPFTPGWTLSIGAIAAAALWLSFFAYRHVEYSNELWWQFAFHANAPRSLRATVGILGTLLLVGVGRLLRPAPADPGLPSAPDLDRARAVITGTSRSEANLVLLGDKHLLFNDAGSAFIMYGVEGRSWVALHDPVGPEAELAELAWRFRELADRHAGWTVFYEVGRGHLPLYLDLGLTLVKMGEEARVPLPQFTLEGAGRKTLRRFHRAVQRMGATFEVRPRSETGALLPALRPISDAWLALKQTREKGFSLGHFDDRYLEHFPIGLVRQAGRIVAFANLWCSGDREEISVDLMRYLPDAAPNVMTYLFVELMLWARTQGYHWFNLGIAPLSGLPSRKLAPRWSRVAGFVYRQGEHFYNFQGLRQYKERFDPVWEPIYLASPGGLVLPRVLGNIATLVGGGVRGVVGK